MKTFMLLLAAGCAIETGETSDNIVGGTPMDLQAVVQWGGCTGTFINPHYILTAAHCLPQCKTASQTACWDGSGLAPWGATYTGRDGAYSGKATDGLFPGTANGNSYTIDFVHFPQPGQFVNAQPDIALLHTSTAFTGQPVEVMPSATVPTPGNLCSQYEGTWPWMVGFSDNAGSTVAERRIGSAGVECDIEAQGRAFKVDDGSRICKGDSGGPLMWRDPAGHYTVGGVASYTDNYDNIFTDTQCPSPDGESGYAFVARPFISTLLPTLTVVPLGPGYGTVTSSAGGIACSGIATDCLEDYEVRTALTLTATPATNQVFSGWSGACSGSAPTCTLTMWSDTTVSAKFCAATDQCCRSGICGPPKCSPLAPHCQQQ